jgi:hypothetical protein
VSAVASVLDEAWAAMEALGAEPPPQLITVRPGVGVSLLDLGFDDPLWCLMGLLAPPEALAVGIATGGWALPPELAEADLARGRMIRPSAHPDGFRVRTLVLLDRSGAGASRVQLAGGAPRDAELPDGFATDVLRRTLELPTPPAAVPVDELLASTWLSDIAGCSRLLERRLSWEEALELRVRGIESWADARRAVALGLWPELDLTCEAAVWMDDGIFARWCFSRYRPLAALVLDARRSLRASAYRQVRAVVAPECSR